MKKSGSENEKNGSEMGKNGSEMEKKWFWNGKKKIKINILKY